jgi:hypothetical protein
MAGKVGLRALVRTSGDRRGWWRILDGAAAPTTRVTAVVRRPNQLDIFVAGTGHPIDAAAWQP